MALSKKNQQVVEDIQNVVFPRLTTRVPVKSLVKIASKDLKHYLYENKSECFCTACEREFVLDSLDKHNLERKCPKCHKNVTVQRMNGTNCIDQYSAVAYPEIFGDYLVLRYYRLHTEYINLRNGKADIRKTINEVGRIVYTDSRSYRFALDWHGIWNYVNNSLFAVGGHCFHPYSNPMGYCGLNKLFVLNSYIYAPTFIQACKRFLNPYTMGYINEFATRRYKSEYDLSGHAKDFYNQFFEDFMVNKADQITEKIIKEGYSDLLTSYSATDYSGAIVSYVGKTIHKRFRPDRNILNILNVTKSEYAVIKDNIETLKDLHYMKSVGIAVTPDNIKAVSSLSYYRHTIKKYHLKDLKVANYVAKCGITTSEYFHYIRLLTEANMRVDEYAYPKDFRKSENDVMNTIDTLNALKRERELAEYKKKVATKNGIIHTICTALSEMKDIERYLGGSNGLLVKVPETAEELVEEGNRLHNCLRTYVDRVARGECLIFFIRRADRPDEPFYAMEYRNGEIRQLYADHNQHDKNYDVVYTFCSDFIKILNDLKLDTKSLAKAVA